MTGLNCKYSHYCSGCDSITLNYEAQKYQKIERLRKLLQSHLLPEIQFQSFGTHGLRSRLDFTINKGNIGLYSHSMQKIVDLPECLQLSNSLQLALDQFRQFQAPVEKGSFRIRISPQDLIGIWLDFSNEDIKKLLSSRTYLENLKKIGHVEIGQRHKSLFEKPSGELGLDQPQFHPWSESFYQENKIQLLSTVASFTQPSHTSNAWITKKIENWCKRIQARNILEFGSGIGNLSFPALSYPDSHLTALEYDGISFQALKKNVHVYGLENRVNLLKGDYRKNSDLETTAFDLLLLNPARNGVGDLLNQNWQADHVIYMSCYPESFALDTQNLHKHGYSLQELIIVDQFPQTHHMEILSFWERGS